MVDIVKLGVGEAERLRRIRLASLKDSPGAFASTYQEVASRPRSSWVEQARNLPTFIAVQDGIDCGIVRGAPHPIHEDDVYLLSMWVAPEARGLGIGEALVDALNSWACSEGYRRVLLNVIEYNRVAIALYEKKGFKATGNSSALPKPREHVSEIEMALEL